jgi:hypothetical protein
MTGGVFWLAQAWSATTAPATLSFVVMSGVGLTASGATVLRSVLPRK